MSSDSVAQASGFNTTRALGTSPHFSSGTGITPASSRVSEDGLLQFERGDVLSPADDDVFLAIDDKQVAVFVDCGHVSRVEPAATQCFRGRTRLPPVSLHHAITPRNDLADAKPVA